MDQLTHAKFFAATKHAGQCYGVLPYTHHLEATARVIQQFGPDPFDPDSPDEVYSGSPSEEEMLIACWLHDVVEDTDAKVRDVEELFGEEVAKIVRAVTSVEGPNRKTRNALTYPNIRNAGPYAVRVKLADRISHIWNGGGSVSMYWSEQEDFHRQLYTPGQNEDLWETLRDAFEWKLGDR